MLKVKEQPAVLSNDRFILFLLLNSVPKKFCYLYLIQKNRNKTCQTDYIFLHIFLIAINTISFNIEELHFYNRSKVQRDNPAVYQHTAQNPASVMVH